MKLSSYKNTVWKWFALYIKVRDADENGYCNCCTCGKLMRWDSQECQAGHFVSGRGNSVLFDDRVVNSQCFRCNLTGGEQFKYGLFLKKKYGYDDGTLEELQNLKFQIKKYTLEDLKSLKETYQQEFERIKKEKGL